MTDLNESINVWVHFKGVEVKPFAFFWRNRQIKIESVNLVHTTKDGNNLHYHFAVSSGGNFYQLRFELSGLKWFIEKVEEDVSIPSPSQEERGFAKDKS